MTLLSCQGWTAAAIAELLGCDPSTVRRWIHRYNTHGTAGLCDRPRAGRPGSATGSWVFGSIGCSPSRWPGRSQGCGSGWAPAISRRTLHRRVREGRLLAAAPAGRQGRPRPRDQVLAGLRQTIATLRPGAVVLAERDPPQPALGARDLDRQRHPASRL